MGILDFTEIPRPVKNNSLGVESEDLDAFEKFAEEFFERILGAKIIERIRRGPDNGLDLKIERNGEHQLVSCKHYAHSDRSIGTTIEEKPVEATISNHCDSFIGFYSTIPHESLIKTLEGCKNNPKYTFNYEIFKSSDIESKLLDSNNAKGWLLAARYFPRSFVNLFRRFVVPIQHYKVSDVKKTGNSWLLEGPFGARVTGGTPEELVETANENLTSALHCNFFKEAIMDAIKLFPRYFVCTKDADFKKLKLEDISPAWNERLIPSYLSDCNTPLIVPAIWSFWDSDKALEVYTQNRKALDEELSDIMVNRILPTLLCVGNTAKFSSGKPRDILSRMLAFAPSGFDYLRFFKIEDVVSFEYITTSCPDWKFSAEDGLEWLIEHQHFNLRS